MASVPEGEVPPGRLAMAARVIHADIYPREIAHRRQPRKSYRG